MAINGPQPANQTGNEPGGTNQPGNGSGNGRVLGGAFANVDQPFGHMINFFLDDIDVFDAVIEKEKKNRKRTWK